MSDRRVTAQRTITIIPLALVERVMLTVVAHLTLHSVCLTPWRMSRRPPDYLVADELCVLLDPLVRFITLGVRASSEAYASGAQRQESG